LSSSKSRRGSSKKKSESSSLEAVVNAFSQAIGWWAQQIKESTTWFGRLLWIGGGLLALALVAIFTIALVQAVLEPEAPVAAPTRAPTPVAAVLDEYPQMPQGLERGLIVNVVDGDTADVEVRGQRERLRLIGLDTPETVAPRRPVECFGREASARAHELLEGQSIFLEADPTQGERDRYNRLLRYIWLPDGRLFNLEMIASGYGHEYTFNAPYKYQAQFREAQQRAETQALGLWSPETCAGDTRQAAEPAPGEGVAPTRAPTTGGAATCPEGCITPPDPSCDIKGNVNRAGDRIYHLPGGQFYEQTVINPDEGDRWFCDPSEAEGMGFRGSQR
jgi:micrococcal nuclease